MKERAVTFSPALFSLSTTYNRAGEQDRNDAVKMALQDNAEVQGASRKDNPLELKKSYSEMPHIFKLINVLSCSDTKHFLLIANF
jgi:hypothetical protein